MPRCPSCSSAVPEGKRFCADCGAALETPTSAPTETSFRSEPPGSDARPRPPLPSDPATGGRFIPGTVLGKRYRILGLLGRGGMGEVYRADDLKLGIPVALKFLPEAVERDEGRLRRFLNEVRTALRVTHPNVCRVHDVGDVDGHHYISMEYVDGEDLASLLRRIGRLPRDKAAQIARQLCAGLAAAHEEGILHRDLKPANVMIDGRGRAKITDFGLAGLAEGIEATDVRAGTPAYMAPEQLAGKEVTLRSDLYALGLVLYEVFTGKRAFEARTPAEMLRLQQESTPSSPSSLVEGLDPAVERAILRCLEREPRERPSNALAVAASLPGGDPLAAALAAGETPSPEMVAAAGGEGALRPPVVLACLAILAVAFVVEFFLSSRYPAHNGLAGYVSLEKPAAVLARDAEEILASLGHAESPADRAWGFRVDDEYLDWIEENDTSPDRWERFRSRRPSAVYFWYRQSPWDLHPTEFWPGAVDHDDPHPSYSGEALLDLDPSGRLQWLLVVPPERSPENTDATAPDWSRLFRAAGLDPAAFVPVEPRWVPDVHCDTRAAWEGTYGDEARTPIRIEAGAQGGKVVSFRIVEPWTHPRRMEKAGPEGGQRIVFVSAVALFTVMMIGAVLLARRNVRSGRADLRGATRLAVFVVVANMVKWCFAASHVAGPEEFDLFTDGLMSALFFGAMTWVGYVALEPFLRRRWPGTLVSWNRLLAGRLRDPRIGRDVLAGITALYAFLLLLAPAGVAYVELGLTPDRPSWNGSLGALLGPRGVAVAVIDATVVPLGAAIGILFLFVLLRIVLRKEWLAMVVFVLIFAGLVAVVVDPPALYLVLIQQIVLWTTIFLLLSRFGFLSVYAFYLVINLGVNLPTPADASWYEGTAWFFLLVVAALALWSAWVSLAGQPLFGKGLVPREE